MATLADLSAQMTTLGDVATALLSPLASLTQALSAITPLAATLSQSLAGLADTVRRGQPAAVPPYLPVVPPPAPLPPPGGGSPQATGTRPAAAGDGMLKGLGDAAVVARTSLAELSGVARGAVQGMAMLAGGPLVGALGSLGGMVSQFVGALNPAAVQVFQMVMRDLSAVVGVALMPVLEVLTSAVREVSSLLLPVAQELAPVFSQIGQTLLAVLQPVLQVMANTLRNLIPLLQLLADVMAGLAPILQAWGTIAAAWTRTLGEMFASLFGSGYQDAMKGFQTAMQRLAGFALTAAGALARIAAGFGVPGADRFLANLIEAARGGKKQSAEGLGAATAGQVTQIPQFAQAQLAAAFTASSGGQARKTQEQWLEDVATTLQQIKDGTVDPRVWLEGQLNGIKAAIETKLNEIAAALGGKTYDKGKEILDKSGASGAAVGAAFGARYGPIGALGGAVGGFFGR